MDGAEEDQLGWIADGLAAAVLAAAVGTCLLLLGVPQTGVVASAVSGLLTLAMLRQVQPEPRRFRLHAFTPLDRVEQVLELVDLAEPEPLLLEDRLDELHAESRVVQLFAARSMPTPGELQKRIEAHLAAPIRPPAGGTILELEVDAAAALRQALRELRRNLA